MNNKIHIKNDEKKNTLKYIPNTIGNIFMEI